jgi:hypothetical protein
LAKNKRHSGYWKKYKPDTVAIGRQRWQNPKDIVAIGRKLWRQKTSDANWKLEQNFDNSNKKIQSGHERHEHSVDRHL